MTSPDLMEIVRGERTVHEVARDQHHVAFLAERPVRPGHIVVATTQLVDSVADLDATAHGRLWQFVHTLQNRMRDRLPCQRVCINVIGWAVRHAHVHLIPTDEPGQIPGLDGQPLPPTQATAIATRLTT